MILTTFKRITRTGFVNFWRNGFLSFAAIVVMTLALCSFGAIIFTSAFGRSLITDVKEKVDINIYFALSAPESEILAFQREVNVLPEVSSTTYVSRESALATFTDKWRDNALIMQGLSEIGSNPFPASINIKAHEPGQYGAVADFIQKKSPTEADGSPLIDKVNYSENKLIIDRLGRIIPAAEKAASVVALALVIVAIVVVWNTIRLIVYTERDEIAVMKLVGASNVYVRGPMVVSGLMYGFVSGAIALVLMAAFAYWGDDTLLKLAGVQIAADFSILVNVLSNYFVANLPEIMIIILGAGLLLGGVSSYIAARRYLRV